MEWKTGITDVQPNKISIRGYPIEELINKFSYGEAVFLLLKGELPTSSQGKMMNAILVSTIDHSVTAPSACATRFVASGGSPIQSAVSAGLSAIGTHHGGAIEEATKLFQEGVKQSKSEGKTIDQISEFILKDFKEKKKRLPGYGHPYHRVDPRVKALFKLAEELNLKSDHSILAQKIEANTEKILGRFLQMNVDAVMGAIIADMGFDWRVARGIFLISRCAGLVAHAYEEYTREKPFRAVDLKDVKYDGPNKL